MGEQVEIDLVANDRASPAWKQQADMVHKYMSELAKLDSTQKANERSARDYDKAARQAIESGRTPLERYNAKVAELKGLLDKNKLSQDEYTKAIKRTAQELGDANAGMTNFGQSSSFADQAKAAAGLLIPLGGVTGALQNALAFQKQLTDEATKTTLQLDKAARFYQVQSGFKDIDRDKATADIINVAEANAVDVGDAMAVSKQLVSSGFADPEKRGTADVMLKMLASSNLDSSKGEDMAKAAGQFMVAFRKDKNDPANLLELGVRTRGLFKQTDVQMGDLGEYAQSAPAFADAGVSLEHTMSTNAILREAMNAADVKTQGKTIVSLMTTFGKEKAKAEELKKLGLKPGQLDLTGETLPEALAKLEGGMARLNGSERSGVLKTLFGDDAKTGASILLSSLDKYEKFGAMQGDKAGFEEGVRTNQSGPNAQLMRLEARKARERLKYKEQLNNDALLNQEFVRQREEYGLDAKSMGPAGFFYNAAVATGAALTDAALYTGVVTPSMVASGENRRNVERGATSSFSLDALQRSLDANTKAVERNNEVLKIDRNKPQKFEAKADPTPAAPRPAAALGSR